MYLAYWSENGGRPLPWVYLMPAIQPRSIPSRYSEHYLHHVSTCSVDGLVKAMGASGVSKSLVSCLVAEIGERVNALPNALPEKFPKLADMMGASCEDVLAYMTFPKDH